MAASVNCKKGDAKFPTAQLSRQNKKRKNETKRSDESRSKNFLGGIYKENQKVLGKVKKRGKRGEGGKG